LSVKDLSKFGESSCEVPGGPACSASQGNVPTSGRLPPAFTETSHIGGDDEVCLSRAGACGAGGRIPGAAIDELNKLVASVDGMGVPDPKANKVAALTNVVVIATHAG